MKALLQDAIIALLVALLVAVVMLFATFDSTFIYRGF
jgi:hypothetical protein